jgi:hypothetical protein
LFCPEAVQGTIARVRQHWRQEQGAMDKLRQARDAVDFTRARLARESGVPVWKIAQAELEQYQLTAQEHEALRRVLKPEVVKLVHSLLEFQAVE